MERSLCLPEDQQRRLVAWATDAYPHEACGLLLGRQGEEGTRVIEAFQARNIATSRLHDRFEIDPVDYLEAESRAASCEMNVVGIWHTHPDHPASPSSHDQDLAWEGWSYLILAVTAEGVADLRSWRLNSDRDFEEEEVRS